MVGGDGPVWLRRWPAKPVESHWCTAPRGFKSRSPRLEGEKMEKKEKEIIDNLKGEKVTVVYTMGGYVQSLSGVLKDHDKGFLLLDVDGKGIYLALDKVVSMEKSP